MADYLLTLPIKPNHHELIQKSWDPVPSLIIYLILARLLTMFCNICEEIHHYCTSLIFGNSITVMIFFVIPSVSVNYAFKSHILILHAGTKRFETCFFRSQARKQGNALLDYRGQTQHSISAVLASVTPQYSTLLLFFFSQVNLPTRTGPRSELSDTPCQTV